MDAEGGGAPCARVQAMSGGETLRSEAINFNSTMLPKVRAKGVARLRDALHKGAKGGDALTIPLLAGAVRSFFNIHTPRTVLNHPQLDTVSNASQPPPAVRGVYTSRV